jgi:RNA polymerase sigma-70 factor, ECF subfamily
MQNSTSNGDERVRRSLLKELFEKNYEKVYKKAYMLLFNAEMAKDATQEAFLKAYQKIDSLKDIDRFEVWIYAIIQNICRNMIKNNHYRNKNIVLYDNEQDIKYNIDELKSKHIQERFLGTKSLEMNFISIYVS